MFSESAKIVLVGLIALLAAAEGSEVAVTIEDAPYFVRIQDRFGLSFCVGALISPQYVLTTSGCVRGDSAENIIVNFGAGSRDAKGVKYAVKEAFAAHESTKMDIAVLKLEKAVEESQFRPIDMCTKSLKKDDEFEVTGYGHGGQVIGTLTDPLNRGTYKVTPMEECTELYADNEYIEVSEYTFCADTYRNILGEVGGPAVHDGKLCGLAAGGSGNLPGVFIDIFAVKDFIEKSMKA